jgi:hypothetical protein
MRELAWKGGDVWAEEWIWLRSTPIPTKMQRYKLDSIESGRVMWCKRPAVDELGTTLICYPLIAHDELRLRPHLGCGNLEEDCMWWDFGYGKETSTCVCGARFDQKLQPERLHKSVEGIHQEMFVLRNLGKRIEGS